MKLRLSWTDPVSQRTRQPLLNAPIALGQAFTAMPEEISGKSVSRMVIGDRQIRDFQALLVEIEGEIYLIDNGGQTYINQQQVSGQERLEHGDRIRIGQTELQLQMMDAPPTSPNQRSTHLQKGLDPAIEPSPSANGNGNGNGHNGATINAPNQANISAPGIPQPGQIPGSPLNGHSSNGNGISQPLPVVPAPSALNGKPTSPPTSNQNDQQLPPVHQSNGHLPQINEHGLGNGQHRQSNGFANPDQIIAQPQSQTPAPSPLNLAPAGTPQPMELAIGPSNSGCRRMVGFLFKRPCGRNNTSGCDHCANGYSNHAYSADYDLYEGFGRFEPGDWGYGLLENQETS